MERLHSGEPFKVGFVDESYFNGKHDNDLKAFYASMRVGLKRIEKQKDTRVYEKIIDARDLFISDIVLDNVRMSHPEDECLLLFFCARMEYYEKESNFIVRYPILKKNDDSDYVREYLCDKRKTQIFLQCRMYTRQPEVERYNNMISMGIEVSNHHPMPVRRQSIVDEGQMKILMDIIESILNITFNSGDRILVVGSSASGGNMHGLAYDIIGLMVKEEVVIDLYDCYDVDSVYTIGSVTFQHHRGLYCYDGSESCFKMIFDDAWEDGMRRSWDPDNDIEKASFFSMKFFESYHKRRQGFIYKQQAFHTDKSEERATNIVVDRCYENNYLLGHCVMCTELKYLKRPDMDVAFYDFFMSYHSVNCVSGQKRMTYGYVPTSKAIDWYYVRNLDNYIKPIFCTSWDPIPDYEVIYPNVKTFKDVAFIFSNVEHVRPDIGMECLTFVLCGDVVMVNRQDVCALSYYDNDLVDEFVVGEIDRVVRSLKKNVEVRPKQLRFSVRKDTIKKKMRKENERAREDNKFKKNNHKKNELSGKGSDSIDKRPKKMVSTRDKDTLQYRVKEVVDS